MLIDEVKPEKSSRLSGGRVTQAREDVPGCGNNEENRRAGEQPQAKQMAKISRQQQKNKNNAGRKGQADQPFGEHIQCDCRSQSPAGKPRWRRFLKSLPKKCHASSEPEADDDIGDEKAGEKIDAERSQND